MWKLGWPFFIILTTLIASCACAQQIISVTTHPTVEPETVDFVSYRLRSRDGLARFLVNFSRLAPDEDTTIVVSIGDSYSDITLSSSCFPEIDFFSVEVLESRVGSEELELSVRYGGNRLGCFSNDDGRNRISLRVNQRGLRSSTISSYPDCISHVMDGELLIPDQNQ